MDEDGNQLYFLQEESSCLMRSCCANSRELQVSFQTNDGQEILRFNRPLRCMECCSDCCYPNWTQVFMYQADFSIRALVSTGATGAIAPELFEGHNVKNIFLGNFLRKLLVKNFLAPELLES